MPGTDQLPFAEFVKRRHDTHSELADRVLDELSAVAVLPVWERTVDEPTRGFRDPARAVALLEAAAVEKKLGGFGHA